MDYLKWIGLVVLVIWIQQISCQSNCPTSITNCDLCAGNDCITCKDDFANGPGSPLYCCSVGCKQDRNGFHDCDRTTGQCTFDGCIGGYAGANCERCSSLLQNCDICESNVAQNRRVCTQCSTGFFKTPDDKCCLEGCDVCNDRVCTQCGSGWFLYNEGCDQCGENCRKPADLTARCNATSESCLYGCETNWHGSRCNKLCNINNCEECAYNEPNDLLTCIRCAPGFWGNNCVTCPVNCRTNATIGINTCDQFGSCRNGCVDGYRGAQCNIRCNQVFGLENCLVCARTSLQCSACRTGFWGTTCQRNCSNTCFPLNGMPFCDIADGRCSINCSAGYWGNSCVNACPNCTSGACNRTSGRCTTRECLPGYYQDTCLATCPLNCAPNPSTGQAFCDLDTGACTYGCRHNFYGTKCTEQCSPKCSDATPTNEPFCDQVGGTCKNGCKAGYYTRTCTVACQAYCWDNTCSILAGTCPECDKPLEEQGYLCPTGTCGVGYWGQICDIACEGGDRCLNGVCHRQTGNCGSCIPYHWETYCQEDCQNCVDGLCVITTGVCSLGCIDGYNGRFMCTSPCHDRCTVCERITGECLICDNGTFGATCEKNCSDHCKPAISGVVTCSKDNGFCDSQECLPGYFGPGCNLPCNGNCAPDVDDIAACAIATGACSVGCKVGFYGPTCDGKCSVTCRDTNCIDNANHCVDGCIETFYGGNCDLPCNTNCVNSTCQDADGYCTTGCLAGFYGPLCEEGCTETCIDDTCDRQSGFCEDCLTENPSFLCRTAGSPLLDS